jgi:hypothetical protein
MRKDVPSDVLRRDVTSGSEGWKGEDALHTTRVLIKIDKILILRLSWVILNR